MKVAKIMSSDVHIASPNDSIEEIARIMASEDIGFLPVGENDRLIGTITDRDIVIRGVASGKDGDARVRDVMTREVKYCFSDEEIDHVIENMGDLQVRRLPVVNRDKRLVGVVSLADAALKHDPEATGSALTGVVEPGGNHTQMQ
ncbi:CBS domain-containing protein [Dongia soli]|uniref:CBS domain-containing protein n=1 Tax=Dongia soli TaxID=600628 RepID=A0ABU5EE17_9PROT|nr:CBS domain-containing protein [Dongia soli]MDY0884552.1 CBS domain-containing protein [Dongia soli]